MGKGRVTRLKEKRAKEPNRKQKAKKDDKKTKICPFCLNEIPASRFLEGQDHVLGCQSKKYMEEGKAAAA